MTTPARATGARPDDSPGDLFNPACPTRQVLDRLSGKWESMLIKVLAGAAPGEVRFAELRRRVSGISQKMLSQTLRSLERDGLVARRVEPTVPPAVHYSLTPLGLSLDGPLDVLRQWAERHVVEIETARTRYDEA
ncbi:winged helix-turn-helix transcriptional regulator [Streptoalloteichus hindustanus]|uniref:Transcriptional regulator, HxlR family n=1 Tax=Streptoalloteichus hindustanus TaxID=2017 RepID=A0A1M4ZB56_STRHI|nr:helix-turn-helix domain-containing protein [Streptoalloteichus hindustanus]SHF15283.1 transcriptional regulator, HxlR family [Streptoalloteichus hindustanus]